MFKKRSLALLLAVGMLVMPFAVGCEEKEETPPGPVTPQPEPEPEPEPSVPEKPDDEPEAVYTLSLDGERYLLSTVEGAGPAEVSATLKCDGEAFDGTVEYTVADPKIATFSDGKLTAVATGKTSLTATYTPAKGEPVTDTAAVEVLAEATAESVNALDEESVNLLGRTYFSAGQLALDNPCTGVEVAFVGTGLSVKFATPGSYVAVFTDGGEEVRIKTQRGSVAVAEGLEEGLHLVRIVKSVGPNFGNISLETSPFETDGKFLTAPEKPELKIEFIGDSITEGIGTLGTSPSEPQTMDNSDCALTYAYLTAQTLNADYSIIALAGICVKDSGTNMYDKYTKVGFKNSAEYDFSEFDADIVVLALGENDMWHATSDQFPNYSVELLRQDYADMLRLIREKRPNAHIVCIYGMMPASSTTQTKQLITAAIEDTGDENISQRQMLRNEQGGNYHPSAAAHKQNAKTLTKHIRSILD